MRCRIETFAPVANKPAAGQLPPWEISRQYRQTSSDRRLRKKPQRYRYSPCSLYNAPAVKIAVNAAGYNSNAAIRTGIDGGRGRGRERNWFFGGSGRAGFPVAIREGPPESPYDFLSEFIAVEINTAFRWQLIRFDLLGHISKEVIAVLLTGYITIYLF